MCSFKITLLIGRVSLVLSMPFVYNLGFGSYKHMFAANNPSSKGILVRAGVHSVSEYQEKCVAFTAQQQLFALCFLDLEDFLLISICRQINGNIIYFPWKKKLDLSQCGKRIQTTLWIWANLRKKSWRLQERLPRGCRAASKQGQKGPAHSLEALGSPAFGDQDWAHQGPEPAELAASERWAQHLSLQPHAHRAIPAQFSPAHAHVLENIHHLDKRRRQKKEKQVASAHKSTG